MSGGRGKRLIAKKEKGNKIGKPAIIVGRRGKEKGIKLSLHTRRGSLLMTHRCFVNGKGGKRRRKKKCCPKK